MTQATRRVQAIERINVSSTGVPVERQTDDPIGQVLRQAYDGVVSEPVPDRFTALLDELRKKEGE
ncbi:MAG: NepR family anti-sigma factor [Pseudomonadota bacterium]